MVNDAHRGSLRMSEAQLSAPARRMPSFGEFVAMMAGLMAMTALSIDVMLPALPQIRADFQIADANAQQLVVTSYVLGFALGQLFHGPQSDWLGRRPVLLAGLGVYALASFGCLVAPSFGVLLAARFLQGAANAAPRVIAIAVVRDVYGGRRMAEVMSFVMMVFIIVPVLAPSIGGAFLLAGSWHLIFAFLFVVSLALLAWMALRLPETQPPERRRPLSVAWLTGAFGETVRTRQTLGYTLATGTVFGALMGYINSAQQVFVEVYDLGALFPLAFGCVAAALALAAFLNSRFVGRLGMRRVSHAALIGFAVTALLHLGLDLAYDGPPLAAFVLLLALDLFFFGLLMPNFNAIAMEPMGHIAGTASSFVGAVTTGLAAGLGWVVGQHYDGTATPLLAGFAVFGVLGLLIVLVTEKGRLFGTSVPATEPAA
jgi:MFS transporter, DHA1 family, multidrug resistance protein